MYILFTLLMVSNGLMAAQRPYSEIIQDCKFRYEQCTSAAQTKEKIKQLLPCPFTPLTTQKQQDAYVGLSLNYWFDTFPRSSSQDAEIEHLLTTAYLPRTFFDVPAPALLYALVPFKYWLVQKLKDLECGDVREGKWQLPCNDHTLLMADFLEKSGTASLENLSLNWQEINKAPTDLKIKLLKNIFICLFLKDSTQAEMFVRALKQKEQQELFRAFITQLRFSPLLNKKYFQAATLLTQVTGYGWWQKACLLKHHLGPARKLAWTLLAISTTCAAQKYFLKKKSFIFWGLTSDIVLACALGSFWIGTNTPVKELYI